MSRKSLAPRSGVVARSTSTLPARSIDWRSLILSVGVSAGVLVAITLVPAMSGLRSAEVALTAGDFRFALLQAEQELRSHPNSSQALLIAGFAAQGLRQPDVAIHPH